MHTRNAVRLVTFAVAVLASLAVTACAVEDADLEDEEVGAVDEAGEAELAPLDEELSADHVREAAMRTDGSEPASIQVHDYNGICADTLTLRDVPGGYTLCTMTRRNAVYVYDVSGQWAYIRVLAGGCEGHVGWALKNYISRLCL